MYLDIPGCFRLDLCRARPSLSIPAVRTVVLRGIDVQSRREQAIDHGLLPFDIVLDWAQM